MTYIKHGSRRSRLYVIWTEVKQRCCNPNNKNYHNYGGRGIELCSDWIDNFQNFKTWAETNGYKEEILPNGKNKWTLDRIDVNGDYCPKNCRWITMQEQFRNKRDTIKVKYKGKSYTLMELSEIYNVSYDRLLYRIVEAKWDIEDALHRPLMNCRYKLPKSNHRFIYKNKDGYQIRVHDVYCGFQLI